MNLHFLRIAEAGTSGDPFPPQLPDQYGEFIVGTYYKNQRDMKTEEFALVKMQPEQEAGHLKAGANHPWCLHSQSAGSPEFIKHAHAALAASLTSEQ